MRLLLVSFFCLSTVHSNVIKSVMDYLDLKDPYEFTSPPEKVEMTLQYIFNQYPTLKVTDADDLLELKKSFLEFINMKEKDRNELLMGSSSEHKVLSNMLNGLTKFAKEEFKDLSVEEKSYCETVSDFVWTKLSAEATMHVIKKKRAQYEKVNMSKEMIKMDVALKSMEILLTWYKNEKEGVENLEKIARMQEL